jgi:hypothetical protein
VGTFLPSNSFTDSHLTRRISRQPRTLNLSVIIIRCVPPKRDRPASLIQIPKFSERPSIGPYEVSNEPLRWFSGSLVENQNIFVQFNSAFRYTGLNGSFFFIKVQAIRSILADSLTSIFPSIPFSFSRPRSLLV